MNQGELFTSFLIDLQRIFRTKIVPKNLSYSQILAILVIVNHLLIILYQGVLLIIILKH